MQLLEAKFSVFCAKNSIARETGVFHKAVMLVQGYITISPFSIM